MFDDEFYIEAGSGCGLHAEAVSDMLGDGFEIAVESLASAISLRLTPVQMGDLVIGLQNVLFSAQLPNEARAENDKRLEGMDAAELAAEFPDDEADDAETDE